MDYTQEIIKELKKHGAKGDLNENTVLTAVGIDSLDLMDMVIDLEDRLGISVPDEELQNFKTIGELNQLIIKLKK